jgi:phosphatidylglycerol lysyltransferase
MEGSAAVRPVVGFALLIAALFVLRHELDALSLAQLRAAVDAIPRGSITAAVLLTILNYLVLTGFDQLAFTALGLQARRWRIGLASFLGYAVSNNVGFAFVSGSTVRYRFYSRWGLTAEQIARVVVFYSGTFWLGLLVLGGMALIAAPAPALAMVLPGPWLAAIGIALFGIAAAYATLPVLRPEPVRVGSWSFPVPPARTVAAQFLLSMLDWALAAAVLWVLLPDPRPPLPETLSAFIAAQLLGLVSHVPGGLGVFETMMVVLMKPEVPPGAMAPALIAYRLVYYLLPFAIALTAMIVDESYQSRSAIRRVGSLFGNISASVTPTLLAAATFAAGAILLFSGATPAVASRLSWLSGIVPFPLLEASHFVGSVVGVVLLLLSRAVARRIDAAWGLAVGALSVGILASLLKGGDYEEAAVLTMLLLTLLAARRTFDRKAAVFDAPFSASWFTSVVSVVAGSYFLGSFAFKHVDYSNQLWWRFALHGDAPRFLRASVGAGVTVLAFGLRQLLRPAPPEVSMPGDEELANVGAVMAAHGSVYPYLAYLRDKALLWNASRTGFVMYAVQGRTWVALHDPVGPPAVMPGLVRGFLERVDDYGGVPVFYEVRPECLHHYADFGLAIAKIGEEALVPLREFTLEGSARKGLRSSVNRLQRERLAFRVMPPAEVSARMEELRAVSSEWLRHKSAAEKGFSLGFFDPDYLERFPVAVLEHDGRIEAFTNVWLGLTGREMSVDLMRYRASASPCATEGLFAHLMLWGRERGFLTFSLGMAPLSGLEASGIGPLWRPVARYVYEHGESFYNFQGVRAFKEKFDPVWEPRYLAYPGGLAVARVLADVSALIAGGYRRIFFKAA